MSIVRIENEVTNKCFKANVVFYAYGEVLLEGEAIIDTGSVNSFINASLVEECKLNILKNYGNHTIFTSTGSTDIKFVLIPFMIEKKIVFDCLAVGLSYNMPKSLVGLIGMDVLCNCDMLIKHSKNKLILELRNPFESNNKLSLGD